MLASLLSDHELQTALNITRSIKDAFYRTVTLTKVAQYATDQQRIDVLVEALTSAKAIKNPYNQVEALSELAEQLPEPQRSVAWNIALKSAEQFADENGVNSALELARRVPKVLRSKVFAYAWAAVETIPTDLGIPGNSAEEWHYAAREIEMRKHVESIKNRISELEKTDLLDCVESQNDNVSVDGINSGTTLQVIDDLKTGFAVGNLPEELAKVMAINDREQCTIVLSSLAKWLPSETILEILGLVQAIENNGFRAKALSNFVKDLPEPQRTDILSQIWSVVRNDVSNNTRNEILPHILLLLPPELASEVLDEVLKMLQAIEKKDDETFVRRVYNMGILPVIKEKEARFKSLYLFVNHLPHDLIPKVLNKMRAIKTIEWRYIALSHITVRLSKAQQHGILKRALVKLQRVNDYFRAELLGKYIAYLPSELLPEIIDVANSIKNVEWRGDVLSHVVARLSGPQLNEVLTSIWDALRDIKNIDSRNRVMRQLVIYLPIDLKSSILETIQSIDDPEQRAEILSGMLIAVQAIGEDVEFEYVRAKQVLNYLLTHIPQGLYSELLVAAKSIKGKMYVKVLSKISEQLPEPQKAQVLGDALETAHNVFDKYYAHDEALCYLLPYLSEPLLTEVIIKVWPSNEQQWRDEILRALVENLPVTQIAQALKAIDCIENNDIRGTTLCDLIERLPESERNGVLPTALTAVTRMKSPEYSIGVLVRLADYLPLKLLPDLLILLGRHSKRPAYHDVWNAEIKRASLEVIKNIIKRFPCELIPEALATARTIDESYYFTEPLCNLEEHSQNAFVTSETISGILHRLANQRRIDFLCDLAVLIPLFIQSQPISIRIEIYKAIRNVTTWWP